MYLVFSSIDAAEYFESRADQINVKMVYVPTMEIISYGDELAKLAKVINDYDYVIITSSYAIKLADGLIKSTTNPVFITSGQATATKLIELAINSTVICPLQNSGTEAIITEVLADLDLKSKKVLIVRGEVSNSDINDYLGKIDDVIYHEIVIYQQKLLDFDTPYLKKILKDHNLQGIIITSSQIANHLLSLAKHNGYLDLLQQQKFITLHQNIRDILVQHNIERIYLTKRASYAAIIDKIKGII